LYHIT